MSNFKSYGCYHVVNGHLLTRCETSERTTSPERHTSDYSIILEQIMLRLQLSQNRKYVNRACIQEILPYIPEPSDRENAESLVLLNRSLTNINDDIDDNNGEDGKQNGQLLYGLVLAVVSGIFFTLLSVAVRSLQNINPFQTLFFRVLVQLCIVTPLLWRRKEEVLDSVDKRWLLCLQSVVGTFTLVAMFYAFYHIPVGDAVTIIFSCPVVVVFVSHFTLGERCGIFRTLVVIILVIAIVLIARPPSLFEDPASGDKDYDFFGYSVACVGTVSTALNIVIMRRLKDVSFALILFSYSALTLPLTGSVLLVIGFQEPSSLLEWLLLLSIGLLGVAGQAFLSAALKLQGASPVAVARSLDVVLAYVLQVVLFGEEPDVLNIVGATLVVLCVVAIALEEYFKRNVALCSNI